MTAERNIANLWCHEVADQLEAYVAGRLDDPMRERVETHVAGCEHCASFGARYAALIARVKEAHRPSVDADAEAVAARLRARLGTLE